MKKRYPSLLDLNVDKDFDYNTVLRNDPKIGNVIKNDVINETYKAIEYGIKTKKKQAELFEIRNTRAIINLPRKEWKNALSNVILPYFIENEDYTACCNIRDLIEQI